jgi:sorbitol-specific phosphotransferase system component IIBC
MGCICGRMRKCMSYIVCVGFKYGIPVDYMVCACVNGGGFKLRVGMYRICGIVALDMRFVSSSNVLVVGCAVVSLSFMRVGF